MSECERERESEERDSQPAGIDTRIKGEEKRKRARERNQRKKWRKEIRERGRERGEAGERDTTYAFDAACGWLLHVTYTLIPLDPPVAGFCMLSAIAPRSALPARPLRLSCIGECQLRLECAR